MSLTAVLMAQVFFQTYFNSFEVEAATYIHNGILQFGRRLPGHFRNELVGSLEDCVKKCIQTPRCHSINFKPRFRLCEFNRVGNLSALVEEIGSVYTEIYRWNKEIAGSCWNRTQCNMKEECITGQSETGCIVSDCGDIPVIDGISLISNESIEIGLFSKVEYNCIYRPSLEKVPSRFTCKEHGDWSILRTPRKCLPVDCGNPPSVENADVSLLNDTTLDGSLAYYTCQTRQICFPLIQMINSTNRVVLCSRNGNWTKPGIECIESEPNVQSCGRTGDALEIVYTLDDTRSVSGTEFNSQIDFYQRLTMQLQNVTDCSRVAMYSHAKLSHLKFGFHENYTLNDICDVIGRTERVPDVGNYEIETVRDSLNLFSESSELMPTGRRFVLFFTDHGSADWEGNQEGRAVLQDAADKNVTVIGLHVRRDLTPHEENHYTIYLPSFESASEMQYLEDCLTLLKMDISW